MRFFTALFAALTTFGLAAAAPSSPDPNLIKQVSISRVILGGSGCPQGSVFGILSPDNTIMTLLFSSFEAEWSNTTQPSQEHENCQVIVEFFIPFGITFWVTSIDHRGYCKLGASCDADITTTYYFSGQQSQANTDVSLKGPLDANYLKSDTAIGAAAVTCPCGTYALMNINVGLNADCANEKDQALITVESEDQNWQQVYHLGYSTCS